MVSGDASFMDPGFCVFSAPVRGGVVVSKGDDSVCPDSGVEPSPQQPEPCLEDRQGPPHEKEYGLKDEGGPPQEKEDGLKEVVGPLQGKEDGHPPTLHPADKGDEKNAKELKGLQGKQDGQKEEEGAEGPVPWWHLVQRGRLHPGLKGLMLLWVGSRGMGLGAAAGW
ncbi:unnamed protein product [Rangifer tarandus platyrhynchus]|uniref:Uncharacterized protein n=1 Tax=Rangifer tarandus platyrhynchus TaxID=3082113 RepID=A0AC59Y878_RANTA